MKHIEIQDIVAGALEQSSPVVALESTLITHGLPRPLNLETAALMESEVRSTGAVPATIAVIDGVIHVGLTLEKLEHLATCPDTLKVSSRGLAFAVATGRTAGTTVSGTMWVAHRVGIHYFGTGGIGGVHRGAEQSGDISTDLIELSRTPVAVVCSGAKSILDLPRTLEYLETAGVPVLGYGTDTFPAFFSPHSGLPVPFRVDGPDEAASVCKVHHELGAGSGLVIACPPPLKVDDESALNDAINRATQEANRQGIRGGELTPFLLGRIADLSNGASLRVNAALLRNNARIAAEIAVAGATRSL